MENDKEIWVGWDGKNGVGKGGSFEENSKDLRNAW